MKSTQPREGSADLLGMSDVPSLPPRPSGSKMEPQDWLTGGDEGMGGPLGIRTTGLVAPPDEKPVLRDSPSKRASFVERSPISLAKPLEAENVLPPPAAASVQPSTALEREWDMVLDRLDNIPMGKSEREKRMAEAKPTKSERRRSKSPATNAKAFITRNDISTAGLGLQIPAGTGSGARPARTPSPGIMDNWGPAPSPKRSRSKQDSVSSGSDVGPEEANGYKPKGGAGEMTMDQEKASHKAGVHPNGISGGDGQRRRRTRSKGRQSSVHDLVDLWGGGLDKGAKSPTLPAPSKRSSVIIPAATMKPPPLANKPRAASPQPMGPLSPSKGKASTSQSNSRRLPSATSPTSPESATGRSRPASMFIAPVSASRTIPTDLGIASSSEAAAALALQAPPDTPRSRGSTRRSSISDMVHRYEAIGTTLPPKGQGPGPGPPTKPAALKMHKSTPSTSSFDFTAASPSAAATRFPKLSPTSSPVMTKASLAVPEDTGRAAQLGRDFAKFRTSPTGLPPRSSPVGRLETPFSSSKPTGAGAPINGLPPRRSPLEIAREQQPSRASMKGPAVSASMPPPPSPRMERKVSAQLEPPAAQEVVRSPSPEKPYQGVSRLIDRWQRAVDETGPGARRGGVPVKKAGVVSGGTGST